MSLELIDIGAPNAVALPSDAVEGSLGVIRNRGRVAATATAPASDP